MLTEPTPSRDNPQINPVKPRWRCLEVKAGPRSCCVRSRRALCVVGVDAIHAVAEAAGDCLAAGLRLIAVDFHAVHVGKRKARGGEGLSGGSDVPCPTAASVSQ